MTSLTWVPHWRFACTFPVARDSDRFSEEFPRDRTLELKGFVCCWFLFFWLCYVDSLGTLSGIARDSQGIEQLKWKRLHVVGFWANPRAEIRNSKWIPEEFPRDSEWMLEIVELWVRIAKGFLVDSWGILGGFLRDSYEIEQLNCKGLHVAGFYGF